MYDLYSRGLFGNRLHHWNSVDEWMEDYEAGNISVGFRRKDIPGAYAPTYNEFMVMWCENDHTDWDKLCVSEISSDEHTLLMAEVSRSENYFDMTYSFEKQKMKPAFKKSENYATGHTALCILKTFLDPSSYDDLMELFDTYPDSVIELSAFSKDVGIVPHRNTIIWEVRNY